VESESQHLACIILILKRDTRAKLLLQLA
jgi:hypothetical protein